MKFRVLDSVDKQLLRSSGYHSLPLSFSMEFIRIKVSVYRYAMLLFCSSLPVGSLKLTKASLKHSSPSDRHV